MEPEYAYEEAKAAPDQEPQVQQQLIQLAKVVAESNEIAEAYERKLEKVLRPTGPEAEPAERQIEVMLVPLAEGVRSETQRLLRANRRLVDIMQRIKV